MGNWMINVLDSILNRHSHVLYVGIVHNSPINPNMNLSYPSTESKLCFLILLSFVATFML